MLPSIPTLPPRLRLTDSDNPEEASDGEDGHDGQSLYHSQSPTAQAQYNLHRCQDEEAEERLGRERIERMLQEMMLKQRQRGKGNGASIRRKDEDGVEDEETAELMGLIMASLRKKVSQAEEEAWMYGDTSGVEGVPGEELGGFD